MHKHRMKNRTQTKAIHADDGSVLIHALEAARKYKVNYHNIRRAVIGGDLHPYCHIGTMVFLTERDMQYWVETTGGR